MVDCAEEKNTKIPSILIAWRVCVYVSVCAFDCISFVMMLTFCVCAAIQNDKSFRLSHTIFAIRVCGELKCV